MGILVVYRKKLNINRVQLVGITKKDYSLKNFVIDLESSLVLTYRQVTLDYGYFTIRLWTKEIFIWNPWWDLYWSSNQLNLSNLQICSVFFIYSILIPRLDCLKFSYSFTLGTFFVITGYLRFPKFLIFHSVVLLSVPHWSSSHLTVKFVLSWEPSQILDLRIATFLLNMYMEKKRQGP